MTVDKTQTEMNGDMMNTEGGMTDQMSSSSPMASDGGMMDNKK